MNIAILVIILWSGAGGPGAADHVELGSIQSCLAAKERLYKEYRAWDGGDRMLAFCVEKFGQL